ncbi:hypothetical protein EJB05_50791, partial [Eragrostis curvula]
MSHHQRALYFVCHAPKYARPYRNTVLNQRYVTDNPIFEVNNSTKLNQNGSSKVRLARRQSLMTTNFSTKQPMMDHGRRQNMASKQDSKLSRRQFLQSVEQLPRSSSANSCWSKTKAPPGMALPPAEPGISCSVVLPPAGPGVVISSLVPPPPAEPSISSWPMVTTSTKQQTAVEDAMM